MNNAKGAASRGPAALRAAAAARMISTVSRGYEAATVIPITIVLRISTGDRSFIPGGWFIYPKGETVLSIFTLKPVP
jgi:hypothetical protein